jgi:two-component system chemotaxis response regulator CheY
MVKLVGGTMRFLIVEDDFISRRLMQKLLSPYGESDIAVNGTEALAAFSTSLQEGSSYALICLDIMMPGMDGQQVLKEIRSLEKTAGVPPAKEVKVIMTTALDSPRDVMEAYYRGGCSGYLVKPIERLKLVAFLKDFGLAK